MSASNEGQQSAVVHMGAFTLDTLGHELERAGQKTQLSPLASRFLQLLATRPGELFERKEIIDALWRGDFLVGDPALSRLVSELRRAAGDDAKRPTLVQTVPRRGYRLVAGAASSASASMSGGENAQPQWQRIWSLANRTLLIAIAGAAVIMALALMIRNFR